MVKNIAAQADVEVPDFLGVYLQILAAHTAPIFYSLMGSVF